ncbi:hypothetical protein SISNIDRAFT_553492 [Sistotremastrum niveocremeum HHB9708]|uniref:G-protein coupled receptors family 1 profile domain-containing protein n=1 Tax=Sistotremastrum niveocremeum HHB9708 TaxID=1314777 RepID=A0A164MIA0_9AGAM|nr:hypothetical protein SISNIDRAFT_553492 [Sistotremastrum niveocremeum HHB9708]
MSSNLTVSCSNASVPFDYVFRCVRELELRVGISCSLYSLLFILFVVTLRVYFAQSHAESCFKPILTMVMATFAIATATFILTMYNIITQLQPEPENEDLYVPFSCDDNPDSRFLPPLFLLQLLIVDAFTIYRIWLLYQRKYAVVIFPSVCSLALFGSLVLNIIYPQADEVLFVVYTVNLPLSLALNLSCILFIAARLRKMQLELRQARGHLVLHFFLLSGAVHNLVLFFLLIGVFGGWADGVILVGPVSITCTAAISFDFSVLQIALTKAFNGGMMGASEGADQVSSKESHREIERDVSSNSGIGRSSSQQINFV